MNVQFQASFLHRFLAGFLLSALAGVGIAQTATKANPSTKPVAPAPQITQAINESNLVPLKGTISSLIATAQDQGAAPDSLQMGRAILMLKTTDAQQAAIDKLVNEQQNPKSPYYHQWLTPQQFGAQFGAAPQDIQKITAWLEGHGSNPHRLLRHARADESRFPH
jgi:DNA replication protein DnaD